MENFASARFLLPIMVVFIVVILIPFLQSLVFSFTDYSGYNFADAKFVGFANYVQCFKDPTLLAGLGFTLLYTVATTVLITVIALPLAVVLNRKFFGRNFARSLFFFFSVPSMAVLGLVWQYIFSPLKSGVVNTLLAKIGIDAIPWLSNSELAKFCVIFVAVWAQIGWHATLYLAYLQAMFNHTNSGVTLRYIGLDEEKKNKLYENLDYGFTLDDIKDKDITENEEK